MGDEDNDRRPSRDPDDGSAALTWLERFVEKYWKTMPAFVRVPLFVLFCLLLIYSIYRAIGGEFSVRGVLLQETAGGKEPVFASGHEVVVAGRRYGVNSVGEYYCIFGSKDYAGLLVRGKRRIEVIDLKAKAPQWPEATFNRLDQEFEPVKLAAPQAAPAPLEGQGLPLAPAEPLRGSLIPAAWAAPALAPRVNFALVLVAVTFTSNTYAKTGRFFLRLRGDTTLPLLSDKSAEAATYFPVVPGQKVHFPSLYYFNLPLPEHEEAVVGEIVFEVEGGGFSQMFKSNRETFPFTLPRQPGTERVIRGSWGSEVDVLLVSPYRLVLFDKLDVAGREEPLQGELLRRGFLLTVRPDSPLGTGAQTNALFAGKQVPFQAVQAVLGVLRNHSFSVKTVQYQLELKSGKALEIQIGGSAAFERRPPIPKAALDAILAAKTEEEFRDKIRPYASPTGAQTVAGRKRRR